MASSVFFKFKSQKEPTRVVFDGTGISVFELKREIILRSGLGDGTEFDLHIYADEGMKEVYDDDTTVIPRSTTVIARRIPAKVQGRGGAARYVTGKMPIHAKNSSRREQISKPTTKTQSNTLAQLSSAMTEEEKMAAVFQAQTENFTSREEEMATQQYVAKGGPKKPANVPDHEPPQGYVCYRCGEKGHWIQLCPTNDNPEYDNRPRIKRTTGIPKSFLKTVDRASAMAQNEEGDEAKRPTGLMVTLEGEYVIAEPDKASWEQFQAKAKSNNTVQKTASEEDKRIQELGLDCPIDNKMFIEPMKTPCCEKTYCNDCITNALIESDFVCPACKTEGVLIDDLKTDEEAVEKIKKFLAEKDSKPKEAPKSPASASKQRRTASPRPAKVKPRKSASPSPAPAASTRPAKSATPTPSNGSATSTPADGESASQNLKKRPAEEPLENPKIPKAPKAMQKAQGTQQQQGASGQMMGGMNNPMLRGGAMPGFQGGMPNMMYPGMPMMGTFGGGMGMPNMGMGMMNPMMNPMMAGGMGPGFPGGMPNMNGGFQGGLTGNGMWGGPHNGMGGLNPNMGGGMNGNNMIQHGGPVGGYNNPAGGFQQQPPQMMMNHPQMQQQQQHNMMMPHKQFGYQAAGDDEDAYFRKPVNPHRHQNRQRRVRPSDYREL